MKATASMSALTDQLHKSERQLASCKERIATLESQLGATRGLAAESSSDTLSVLNRALAAAAAACAQPHLDLNSNEVSDSSAAAVVAARLHALQKGSDALFAELAGVQRMLAVDAGGTSNEDAATSQAAWRKQFQVWHACASCTVRCLCPSAAAVLNSQAESGYNATLFTGTVLSNATLHVCILPGMCCTGFSTPGFSSLAILHERPIRKVTFATCRRHARLLTTLACG